MLSIEAYGFNEMSTQYKATDTKKMEKNNYNLIIRVLKYSWETLIIWFLKTDARVAMFENRP